MLILQDCREPIKLGNFQSYRYIYSQCKLSNLREIDGEIPTLNIYKLIFHTYSYMRTYVPLILFILILLFPLFIDIGYDFQMNSSVYSFLGTFSDEIIKYSSCAETTVIFAMGLNVSSQFILYCIVLLCFAVRKQKQPIAPFHLIHHFIPFPCIATHLT